jgi:hypothetical protein
MILAHSIILLHVLIFFSDVMVLEHFGGFGIKRIFTRINLEFLIQLNDSKAAY